MHLKGYHDTNPYHNSVHAADVTQAMHCFLQESKIGSHLTPLESMCALLAAVCHDLDHPGVNQNFLVSTKSHLAALYNVSLSVFFLFSLSILLFCSRNRFMINFLLSCFDFGRIYQCWKVIIGVLHCHAFMNLIFLIILAKSSGRRSNCYCDS